MIAWVLLVTSASAQEPCTVAGLRAGVERAEAAFSSLDRPAFDQAREGVRASLACLTEVLSATASASVHRVEALAAFLVRDTRAAKAALVAMRRADADYVWPSALVGAGHRLRDWDDAAQREVDVPGATIPGLPEGEVRIDGGLATDWPGRRPFVAQWVVDDQRVEDTRYVPFPGEVPRWPERPVATGPTAGDPVGVVITDRRPRKERRNRGLTVAGVTLGVIGAGLLAATVPVHQNVRRALPEDFPRAGRLRLVNNSLFASGAITAGVGATLFTVGVAL